MILITLKKTVIRHNSLIIWYTEDSRKQCAETYVYHFNECLNNNFEYKKSSSGSVNILFVFDISIKNYF